MQSPEIEIDHLAESLHLMSISVLETSQSLLQSQFSFRQEAACAAFPRLGLYNDHCKVLRSRSELFKKGCIARGGYYQSLEIEIGPLARLQFDRRISLWRTLQ